MLSRAYLFSEAPIPPISGRKNEQGAMKYLSKTPKSFDYWVSQAKSYISRREYEQAIWALRKAKKMKPLAAEAHFLLGYSYEHRGNEGLPGDRTAWDSLAEAEYKVAISAGDFLPARYNLALLLERLERFDESRKELEHILTVSPNSALGKSALSALERNTNADFLPKVLSREIPKYSQQ